MGPSQSDAGRAADRRKPEPLKPENFRKQYLRAGQIGVKNSVLRPVINLGLPARLTGFQAAYRLLPRSSRLDSCYSLIADFSLRLLRNLGLSSKFAKVVMLTR